VGSFGASLARLHRVNRALSFDLDALGRALGRSGDRSLLVEMRTHMLEEGESWDAEVVGAALEARSDSERTALVNELLGEIALALDWGERLPTVGARVSVAGPLAVLFFVLAGGGRELSDIVPIVAWGGAGVVSCLGIRREAQAVAGRARQSIDKWIERIIGSSKNREEPID
jgi:hypothetical protein